MTKFDLFTREIVIMKSVFVMWQDSTNTRMWHPVAKLTQKENNQYVLSYTIGANNSNFTLFPNMEDKQEVYTSTNLFSFFRNRLIPESRPEHDSMFEWSGLSSCTKDYLELLAISGGEKKTDHFRIVNEPKNENGYYKVKFFVSSINYLTLEEKRNLKYLAVGDQLLFSFHVSNQVDADATILSKDDGLKIGYLPHYLCKDLKKLLHFLPSDDINITISQLNLDAPAQFKILCEISAPSPNDFAAFENEEFKLITS